MLHLHNLDGLRSDFALPNRKTFKQTPKDTRTAPQYSEKCQVFYSGSWHEARHAVGSAKLTRVRVELNQSKRIVQVARKHLWKPKRIARRFHVPSSVYTTKRVGRFRRPLTFERAGGAVRDAFPKVDALPGKASVVLSSVSVETSKIYSNTIWLTRSYASGNVSAIVTEFADYLVQNFEIDTICFRSVFDPRLGKAPRFTCVPLEGDAKTVKHLDMVQWLELGLVKEHSHLNYSGLEQLYMDCPCCDTVFFYRRLDRAVTTELHRHVQARRRGESICVDSPARPSELKWLKSAPWPSYPLFNLPVLASFKIVCGSPLGNSTRLSICKGSIVNCSADAIVNAANSSCLGGGGVDGAVHAAAGPNLRNACRDLPFVDGENRCLPGDAKLTDAYLLPCKKVIHAVGPNFYRVANPVDGYRLLYDAYSASMMQAHAANAKSVAFSLISAGIYSAGFSIESLVYVGMCAIMNNASGIEDVLIVGFKDDEITSLFNAVKRLSLDLEG